MLTYHPDFDAAWIKKRLETIEFDGAFRTFFAFSGASAADIERVMPVAESTFFFDWEEMLRDRLETDQLWLYETTKDAHQWVIGSGVALLRSGRVIYALKVNELPIPADQVN